MKTIKVKIPTPQGNFIATVDINEMAKALLNKTTMVEAIYVESENDWRYTNFQYLSQYESNWTLQT